MAVGARQEPLQADMEEDPTGTYVEAQNRTFPTHVQTGKIEPITADNTLSCKARSDDGYEILNLQKTDLMMNETLNTEGDGVSVYNKSGNKERTTDAHLYLVSAWLNLVGDPSPLIAAQPDRIGGNY